jgi:23S rRNA pseudouridine1911/1915/1917 synthase
MRPLSFVAADADAGTTLAAAIRRRSPAGTSWEAVRRLVKTGRVAVGGAVEHDPALRLAVGAEVRVEPSARRAPAASGPAVALVHEDADVAVIDKPPGVSSVPFERRERGTAMDLVRAAWRAQGRRQATAQPLLVVHRIDKDTSGLLVYAKNKAAERALARQFREHTARRSYLCVAHGRVPSRRITTELVRDRGDGLRGSARHPRQRGKTAVTHVEALESLSGGVATLCRVRLETGKTHQIRIHLAEAGHPIVGERVYLRDFLRRGGEPLPSPRLLLHAATLGFTHPRDGRPVDFESPLPADFREALATLRRRGSRG